MRQLLNAGIPVDGLFCNLDAGFDGRALRLALDKHGVVSNVCPNRRNGADSYAEYCFDKEMYCERWMVERSNAWMDAFKAILVRFDTTVSGRKAWNYLAFIVIFLKKFTNHNSLNNFFGKKFKRVQYIKYKNRFNWSAKYPLNYLKNLKIVVRIGNYE